MQIAREKLNKEINIIEMVKDWRYFKTALNSLIVDEKKRYDLKERSRYICINPDLAKVQVDEVSRVRLSLKREKSLRRIKFSEGFFSDRESSFGTDSVNGSVSS